MRHLEDFLGVLRIWKDFEDSVGLLMILEDLGGVGMVLDDFVDLR